MYGCETWTIADKELKKLEAFEMWCYRRMLRISWRDHVTNERVLDAIGEERQLVAQIRIRRAKWMGHLLRHENLVHTIIEGTVEGNNRRGRPKKEFMGQVKEDAGAISYQELKRKIEDRVNWRTICRELLPTNR